MISDRLESCGGARAACFNALFQSYRSNRRKPLTKGCVVKTDKSRARFRKKLDTARSYVTPDRSYDTSEKGTSYFIHGLAIKSEYREVGVGYLIMQNTGCS